MSYSGMTQNVIAQFDEYDENELDITGTVDEIIDKSGNVYARVEAFMRTNVPLPSSMVKVNCFWDILDMSQYEECKDIKKEDVLEDLYMGDISQATEKALRLMARILSEECEKSTVKDMTEEHIYSCLAEELDPRQNKEFVRKIALATNLSYSMYQKMLQKMTNCEGEDLYDVDDFLTALVVKYQPLMRYQAYVALKKHYNKVKDTKNATDVVFGTNTTSVVGDEDIESVYIGADFSSVDNLEPIIVERILDHQRMVEFRKERTATKVKKKLIEDINQLLETSSHTAARQARSLAKGHTTITGMFRLKFDPEIFTFLPEGHEFVVETKDEKDCLFRTTKDLKVTSKQADRGEADVSVEAYVNNASDQIVFAGKRSLYVTPPYPDGVEEIYNPFDIMFDSMEIFAYYDPDVFKGARNVKAYAKVDKDKVEVELPVVEVPSQYAAVVPVVGRKNEYGIEAVEVDRKYGDVKEAYSNIWSTTELDDAVISTETRIKKDKKKPNAPVEGTIRVNLPAPAPIYRDTKFSFSNKKGSYDYYAKETVKTGVIDTYARFTSSVEKENAKTETGDFSFDPVEGLVRIEARHRYDVPNTLFGYLRQIALGTTGEEFVDEERYKDYPVIGDWLKEAWIRSDIESSDTVTRNDILTLVFFKYALESTDIEGQGEGEFTYQANYYLAKCHMDELYRVNTYDRYLSFLCLHTEMDDIFNAYSLINRIALRQRTKR